MENITATTHYKCDICEKEFKNNNGLKMHFNIVHNFVKEHQCNICQKVFKLNNQLTSHLKIAHGNKKHHKCDSCGKSFTRASTQMREHVKVEK